MCVSLVIFLQRKGRSPFSPGAVNKPYIPNTGALISSSVSRTESCHAEHLPACLLLPPAAFVPSAPSCHLLPVLDYVTSDPLTPSALGILQKCPPSPPGAVTSRPPWVWGRLVRGKLLTLGAALRAGLPSPLSPPPVGLWVLLLLSLLSCPGEQMAAAGLLLHGRAALFMPYCW